MEDHGRRSKERLETMKYISMAVCWGLTCQEYGRESERRFMDVAKEEEKVAGVRWLITGGLTQSSASTEENISNEKMRKWRWGPEGSYGTWLWYRRPHGAEEARGTQEPGWTVHRWRFWSSPNANIACSTWPSGNCATYKNKSHLRGLISLFHCKT